MNLGSYGLDDSSHHGEGRKGTHKGKGCALSIVVEQHMQTSGFRTERSCFQYIASCTCCSGTRTASYRQISVCWVFRIGFHPVRHKWRLDHRSPQQSPLAESILFAGPIAHAISPCSEEANTFSCFKASVTRAKRDGNGLMQEQEEAIREQHASRISKVRRRFRIHKSGRTLPNDMMRRGVQVRVNPAISP